MATLNLRCRGPSGQVTLSGLDPDMSATDFLELLLQQTGVQAHAAQLLIGFPPQPIQLPSDPSAKLRDLGLTNGDTFTLRRSAGAEAAAAPAPTPAPAPAPAPASASTPAAGGAAAERRDVGGAEHGLAAALAGALAGPGAAMAGTAGVPAATLMDEDMDLDLARALAASLADVQGAQAGQGPSPSTLPAQGGRANGSAPPQGGAAASGTPVTAPAYIPLPDGSCVKRRIIDSDNSCLFNAVGYVMEASRSKSRELRSVIAKTVASDPVTYNDGFLGMENEAYCSWITKPDKWGGAIELSILCRHYQRQIAAYDIRTQRCDIYGQDAGYEERVMLIYDGLHYDALAVAAFESAPEELDTTIFNPESTDGQAIVQGAAKLVEGTHKAKQFTDTANFALRCGVCQIGIKGEKEAVQHAKETGHSNFAEY